MAPSVGRGARAREAAGDGSGHTGVVATGADDERVRVDAWLWAVRLYPSRTAATDACTSGRVRIDGDAVKPARRVAVGDVVEARRADRTGTYRVVRTITKRVGAPVAVGCYEVEAEELHRSPRPPAGAAWGERSRGTGRPTKKERREIERFRRGT